MNARERKLAAILTADIVGFSQLTGADEEGTLEALRAIRRDIVDRVIDEYRGRVVKRMGDGVLVEFGSAVDAVRCAIALQQSMTARNASVPAPKRMEFRIGINLGDVVVEEDGDLMGDAVNIAARLESIADSGGIALSEDAWRQARGKTSVEFADSGYRELKNIALPVRVYSASAAALRTTDASSASQSSYPPLPDKPSIAVLPFLNLGGNQDQEYFADAIAEDIVTALSRWRWFFVIARNSSFIYKNRSVDVKQVGKELGVRYLLEGSVRRSGSRIRITGQLIDVVNAAHIWADNFDRELADIFALEDEITECVVSAIEPAMLHSEETRIARKRPSDLSAFDSYLRGMWHFNKMSEDNYHEALSLFRQCISREPDLALGYIGLARTLYGGAIEGWCADSMRDLTDARDAGRMAISLDLRDAHGHFALSGAQLYLGQHEEALAEAEQAIVLNPNFAFGHFRLGQVRTYIGRAEEAVISIERSIRHSPHDPQLGNMITLLALAHYHAGNYEESLRHAQTAVRMHDVRAAALSAASLARLGRKDEAREALAAFLPSLTNLSAGKAVALAPYANPADQDHLFEGLRLAGLDQAMLDSVAGAVKTPGRDRS